jgi:beta-galactosidase
MATFIRLFRVVLAIFMLHGIATVFSQTLRDEARRQVINLNDRWSYLEDPQSDVQKLDRTQEQWKGVTLPHTWNTFDAVDQIPGYRRSASWYKRDLVVPATKNEFRYVLEFEGVNLKSDVYVNGVHAGGHVGGYIGFTVDITQFLKRGETNTILVRADNSYDPNLIPSQKSDFCIYGGITRNVWLKALPTRFVERVLIKTPKVEKGSAETTVTVMLSNATSGEVAGELEVVLSDRFGKEVARKSSRVRLTEGTTSYTMAMQRVKNPLLWSPSDPALYTASISLKVSGNVVDAVNERYGYRWFEFKDHGPFFLNGERLLLRGTHRHEDYAGLGSALPDSLQRKEMVMIKEMGANFVRLAHYPQAPAVYRACDELGILVWDELPWCRGGMGGDVWKARTEQLLKEQIVQLFNHPSIFIHSLGNELYWLPDFPGGDQVDSLRSMVRRLNTIAHELDPYRLTATRKFTEGADDVDLVSPSMWPGWYSGVYKTYEKAITDARTNFKKYLHIEYGGDSHVGRHTEAPVSGDGMTVPEGWEENIKPQKVKNISQMSDWSESYIVNLFDWYLRISEQAEWFTGSAQWAFKDFPTPLRPENPIPYINEKGLVDRAGKPKDAYYVFKSYWTTSPAFCYIESHTWTERSGPPGSKRLVKVFSNCKEVELFLNGVSVGRRTKQIKEYPASGLSWNVEFREGANELKAVGYNGAVQSALDTLNIRYVTRKNVEADHVELSSQRTPDGTLLITAVVVDRNGDRCLDYNKRIYFASDGPGRLRMNQGTPTGSSVIEMSNGKAQIEFEPVRGAKAVIEARNQDFKGAYLLVAE